MALSSVVCFGMAVIFLAITAADAQLQPDEDDNDDQLLQDPAQLDLEVGDANVTGDLTFPVDQFDHTTQATPSSHHLNVYTQLTFDVEPDEEMNGSGEGPLDITSTTIITTIATPTASSHAPSTPAAYPRNESLVSAFSAKSSGRYHLVGTKDHANKTKHSSTGSAFHGAPLTDAVASALTSTTLSPAKEPITMKSTATTTSTLPAPVRDPWTWSLPANGGFPLFPAKTIPSLAAVDEEQTRRDGDFGGMDSEARCGEKEKCGVNEKCYHGAPGKLAEGATCHCAPGFVLNSQRQCQCAASKNLLPNGRCEEANRVYHWRNGVLLEQVPLSSGSQSNDYPLPPDPDFDGITLPLLAAVMSTTMEDALKAAIQRGLTAPHNVHPRVTCVLEQSREPPPASDALRVTDHSQTDTSKRQRTLMSFNTTTTISDCYYKFTTAYVDGDDRGSLFRMSDSVIPTPDRVDAVLRDVVSAYWGEQAQALPEMGLPTLRIRIPGPLVPLSRYNYCSSGEHDCDLHTTSCAFDEVVGNVTCECVVFHGGNNGRACFYDHARIMAYVESVEWSEGKLWLGLYVMIGLFSVAVIALLIAILLLKTRPLRTAVKGNGTSKPKISVSRYHNRIPRPTLHANTETVPFSSHAGQSAVEKVAATNESTSVVVTTAPTGPDKTCPLSATSSPAVVYITPSSKPSSSGPHDKPTRQVAAPIELATFARAGARYTPTPPPPPPPAASTDTYRLSRVPLATPESSTEELRAVTNYGYRVSNELLPSSGIKRTNGHHHRHASSSGNGAIFSLENTAAVQEATRQHRHSALLNLAQGRFPSHLELSHV